MADFSGLVALNVDELGRPTGLKAMTEGDVIFSSVLTRNIRDTVTTVEDSSGTWNEAYNSVLDGSAFWTSSTASSVIVGNGSSVVFSGLPGDAMDAPTNNSKLVLDTEAAKVKFVKSAFVVDDAGDNISIGTGVADSFTLNMGGGNMEQTGSAKIIARHVHVANSLSGGADCTTTLSTSASISGCPYPPPFSYLAAGNDLGTGVANFYFGSGVSVAETTMGSDGVTFDSTNGYWNITEAGWYEVRGDIAQNVTVSPTTVTNYVITTTGYGGTEAVKSASYSVLRTNIDPHVTVAHWMGYLAAGVKIAIKCDASAGTMKSERGSTASVKRIG